MRWESNHQGIKQTVDLGVAERHRSVLEAGRGKRLNPIPNWRQKRNSLKLQWRGAWVAQWVKHPPSAQVMILGSWDGALYLASWLLPLSLSPSHSHLCLSNKILKKKKSSSEKASKSDRFFLQKKWRQNKMKRPGELLGWSKTIR